MIHRSSPSRGLLGCALSALVVVSAATVTPASASAAIVHAPRVVHASHHTGHLLGHHRGVHRPHLTHAQAERALRRARALRRRHTGTVTAGAPASIDATQRLLALRAALPALDASQQVQAQELLNRPSKGSPLVDCVSFADFCLHYSARSGSSGSTLAQVKQTGDTLEQVWHTELDQLGYRHPIGDGSAGSPLGVSANKFDVYLQDVGSQGYFGYCTPDSDTAVQSPSYCVLDNDFSPAQFGGANPLTSLQATAAHEFFHAVQFAYNTFQDRWLMEGSAVWMEDTVFPDANDYLRYREESPIRWPAVPVDFQSYNQEPLHVYGAFLLFRFLSDRFGDGIVKDIWNESLNAYSTALVRAIVARRRMSWPAAFGLFSAYNTEPATSYADGRAYGAPAISYSATLSRRHRSTKLLRTHLPHLSSAALRILPGQGAAGRRLVVQMITPAPGRSPSAYLVRHFKSGAVDYTPIGIGRRGRGAVRSPIAPDLAFATVVFGNASTAMRRCGRDATATYSCAGIPVDNHQAYTVRAWLR